MDICPDCRGIWFDSGEFPDFVKELMKSEKVSAEQRPLFEPRPVQMRRDIREPDRLCPRCSLVMHKFNYAYDSNIILDRCSGCDGIWTDGGEAKAVARHLKSNPEVLEVGEALIKGDCGLQELRDVAEFGEVYSRLLLVPKLIIPLGDETARQSVPLVTISVIAACALVFVLQLLSGGLSGDFLTSFAFVPARFLHPSIFSSMFLHAGIFHLAFNMLFLWVFGPPVEDRLGPWKYMFLYLFAGICANVVETAFVWDPFLPMVGASGAISGVMGAYLVFYPRARIKLLFWIRIVHLPAWMLLGVWFGFQMLNALYATAGIGGNVAWFAHIGGFIVGGFFAYAIKRGFEQENSPTE